jgi:hypothetical protein
MVDGPPEWIGTYRRVRFTGTTGSTFTAWPLDDGGVLARAGSEAAWQ